MKNIHPIDYSVKASDKERLLSQRGMVIWMVGLSGSGKSTLAKGLEQKLHAKGHYTVLLDGDNLRSGINNNLSFTTEDRRENIRRTAEVAKLYANNGTIVICSLISPTEDIRSMARNIIGAKYFELFVYAPLETCEQRDVKGLYKKARNGEIDNFTGISSPFEEPVQPDLKVDTKENSVDKCLEIILDSIIPKVELK